MPCPSIGPNHFCRVPIILNGSNLFWLGPNHFGQAQNINISPEKSNLNLTKIILTQPKQFGTEQKDSDTTKTIWMVLNHFGPIKGQGIIDKILHKYLFVQFFFLVLVETILDVLLLFPQAQPWGKHSNLEQKIRKII